MSLAAARQPRRPPASSERATPEREEAPLDKLHASAGNAAVSALLQPALESPGRALPRALRTEMEGQLGHDLGSVRVHDGAAAAQTASALDADALTFGKDVVFGAGRFQPDAPSGKTLLAHELAHVVQQRQQAAPIAALGASDSSFEHAATRAATSPGGATLAPLPAGAPAVQRQKAGETKQSAPKKPTLTNDDVTQIKADVESIVSELRSSFFTDEWKIVGIALKWDERDRLYNERTGYEGSDYLDKFLLETKLRAYSRQTAGAAWVEQWGIVYDDIWRELAGQRLRTWKDVVSRSRKQATSGPSPDTQHENLWAKLSKQEAIGVWGILKGMGTAAAGTVDSGAWAVTRALQEIGIPAAEPESAAAWLAQQYDISGDAMFGEKEWSHGEKLAGSGLSAAELGTTGGGIIWQLVMLKAPGGAPKWAQRALLYLGIAGSLSGVERSAKALASIVEQMQTSGQPITAGTLLSNPQFRSEAVKLALNAVSAMSAGSGTNSQITQSASEAWRRAGIYMDLTSAAVDLGNLTEIAASDKPQAEKEKEIADIVSGLISTGISIGAATQQHEQRMSDVAEAKQQKQQSGKPHQEQPAPAPEPAKLEPQKPAQKQLTAGAPKLEPTAHAKPAPETEPHAKPVPEPKAAPEAKPAPEPKPEPEPKPAPQPKPDPEPKPEPTPEPKPEPEAKPKPKPEPEATPKPAEEPKPAPAGEGPEPPKPPPKAPPQLSPLEFGRSGVEMPWVGHAGKEKQSALGFLRDSEFFWAEYQKKFPEHLSQENLKLIADGLVPKVDQKWIEFHPQDASYNQQKLEHHHVGEGSFAVPLPYKLHKAHSVTHPEWRPVATPKKDFDPKTLGPLVPRADVQSEVARHTKRGKMPTDASGNPYELGDVSPKTALWAVKPEERGRISGDLGVNPTTGEVTKKGEQAPTGRVDTEKRYPAKKRPEPPTVVETPKPLKPADPKADPHFTDVMPKAQPQDWQGMFDKQKPGRGQKGPDAIGKPTEPAVKPPAKKKQSPTTPKSKKQKKKGES